MKEFDALAYQATKGSFNEDDEQFLISLLKKDETTGNILDIGCGDGKLTKRVQEVLPEAHITAIDNSVEQIKLATSFQSEINFQEANIADFKSSEQFDCIYSFYAFPHIPKSQLLHALVSIRALLKKGSHFYLFTNICLFDTQKVSPEEREACDINFLDGFTSQINLTSLDEMKKLFEESGYIEAENRQLKTGAKVKDYGGMISWLFVLK